MKHGLLALLVLAGCAAPTPLPEPATSPAPALPSFLDPVFLRTLTDTQGEFPLDVSDDGQTILTCTHGGFTGPAPKYVSENGGATWRELAPEPPTGVSGDCWTTIGDDGTWYFIDSQVVGNTVTSTRDGGKTWIVNRLATPPIGGTADRPYLAALGGASMALTYVQDYLVPGYVGFTRTDDRGATWEEPRRISDIDDGQTNVMHGPILVTEQGTKIRVPLLRFQAQDYPTMNPATGSIGFLTSEDRGSSWRSEPVLREVQTLFTPPAVAQTQGNLYWAFQVRNGSKQDLMLTVSTDDGKTWQEPRRIAGGSDYLGYMWMDAAPDGTALLAMDADARFLGAKETGEHLILFRLNVSAPDLVDWALAVAPAQNAEFSTAVHDGNGNIYAMYREGGRWLFLKGASAQSASPLVLTTA